MQANLVSKEVTMSPNYSKLEASKPLSVKVSAASLWEIKEGFCWPAMEENLVHGQINPQGTVEIFMEQHQIHNFTVQVYVLKLDLKFDYADNPIPRELNYIDVRPGPYIFLSTGEKSYGYWVKAVDPISHQMFYLLLDYQPGAKDLVA